MLKKSIQQKYFLITISIALFFVVSSIFFVSPARANYLYYNADTGLNSFSRSVYTPSLYFGSTNGIFSYYNGTVGSFVNPANDVFSIFDNSATQNLRIWKGGTDYLGINNNSIQRYNNQSLALNPSGGNVGIGTTNPTANLHVIGSTAVSGNLSASGGTFGILAGGGARIVVTDNSGNISATSTSVATGVASPSGNSGYTLRSDGTSWLATSLLYNNGTNIGIGTTSPSQKLQVVGTVNATAFNMGQLWLRSGNEFENDTSSIFLQYNTGLPVQVGSATNSALNIFGSAYIKEDNDSLYLGASSDLRLYHNGTNSFLTNSTGYLDIGSAGNTIFSSGNVGVGTTAPLSKLNINGASDGLKITGSGNNFIELRSSSNNALYIDFAPNSTSDTGYGTPDYPGRIIYNSVADSLQVLAGGKGITINNNGNVGINKTNPGATLDVVGSINSSGTVNGTGLCIGGVCKTSWDAAGNLWSGTRNGNVWNGDAGVGNVGIGTTNPAQKLDILGAIRTNSQVISTLAAGTAPLVVNSNTLVANLNADLLDGYNSSDINPVNLYNGANTADLITTSIQTNQYSIFKGTIKILDFNSNIPSYIYISGTMLNTGVIAHYKAYSIGKPYTIYAFNYGGFLCFHVTVASAYNNIEAIITQSAGYQGSYVNKNYVTSITAAAKPVGTNEVTITPVAIYSGSGGTNYLSKFIDAYTVGNSLLYDNGSNVGIGTTAPSKKLEVTGSTPSLYVWANDSGTSDFFVGETSSGGYGLNINWDSLYTYTMNARYAGTNTPVYHVDTRNNFSIFDTNVGINKTNPGATLDVVGSINASGTVNGTGLCIGGVCKASWDAAGNLWSGTRNGNVWNGDAGVGNVGIGTTNPAKGKLQIYDTTLPSLRDATTTLRLEYLNASGAAGAVGPQITFAQPYLNGNTALIRTGAIRGIKTYASGSYGGGVQLMYNPAGDYDMSVGLTLNHSGNIGIGTTNPGYKVHVLTGDNNPALVIGKSAGEQYLFQRNGSTGFLQFNGAQQTYSGFQFLTYPNSGAVNTVAMSIINNGNVGINKTTPGTTLDVVGGINASGSVNGTLLCIAGDCRASWNAAGAYWTGYGNNIANNNTGNIGVGTTNPRSKLEILSGTALVNGDGANGLEVASSNQTGNNSNARIATNDAPAINIGGSLGFGGRYNSANQQEATWAIIRGAKENATDGNYSGYLSFLTRVSGSTNAERMRIMSNGNVGIGLTNPGAKLHVSGTTYLNGDVTINNNVASTPMAGVFNTTYNTGKTYLNFPAVSGSNDPGYIMHETSATSSDSNKGVIHISPTDDNDNVNDYVTIHGTNDPETIKLYTGGNIYTNGVINIAGTSNSYIMGNLGIGTSSPNSKLQVVGGINATSINSTGTVNGTGLCIAGDCKTSWGSIVSAGGLPAGTNGQTIRNSSGTWVANSVIYNNGTNVGIGTTNPGDMLHIYKSAGAVLTTSLRLSGAPSGVGGGNAIFFKTSGNETADRYGAKIGAIRSSVDSGAADFIIQLENPTASGLNDVMRILSSGNVGIGTTNPGGRLHIEGDSGTNVISDGVIFKVGGYGASGEVAGIGFNYYNAPITEKEPVVIGVKGDTYSSYTDADFFIATRDGTANTEPVERLYIKASGNVGIGTTTPASLLNVAYNNTGATASLENFRLTNLGGSRSGSIRFRPYEDAAGGYISFAAVPTASSYQVATIHSEYGNSRGAALMQSVNGNISFLHASGATESNTLSLYLQNSGNVGINKANPGATLDVVGSINASGTINGTGLCIGGVCKPSWDAAGNLWSGTRNGNVWNGDAGVGNVGIGTTNPGSYRLNVSGNTYLNGTLTLSSKNISGVTNLDVKDGDGYGIRFWSNDSYKISMGNSGEYHYGPVTDYSIKSAMTSTTGRGWTWGTTSVTPVAALSNTGTFQIAGNFNSQGTGNNYFAGNVGIGTSNPLFALDVNGPARMNYAYRDFQVLQGASANNLVRTWNGPLVAGSDSSGALTYTVIETNVPQDTSMMGGFTIQWFESYSSTGGTKTKIDLAGYWNPEANGGFVGWEYTASSPGIAPTIRVGRKISDGRTVFILTHFSSSYPIIVARDLWLSYQSGSASYGDNWAILQTSDISAYTNLDNVVSHVPVGGSGTTNYLPKFTGGLTLGNSLVYDNGTNVGIGTSGPNSKLQVVGGINATSINSTGIVNGTGLCIAGDCRTSWVTAIATTSGWTTNGSTVYKTDTSGNVGIGTTNPRAILEVGANDGVNASIVTGNLIEIAGQSDVAQAADVTITGGTLVSGGPTAKNGKGYWNITSFPSTITFNTRGWWTYAGMSFTAENVHNYPAGGGNKVPASFLVEASADGVTWATVDDVTNYTSALYYKNNVYGGSGRWVRITARAPQSGETAAKIANVQIYNGKRSGKGPFSLSAEGNTVFIGGNVGVDSLIPLSKLGVTGNAAIGATYGSMSAPTSGLIVEGNVGIGTTNPTSKLQISNVYTYAQKSLIINNANTALPSHSNYDTVLINQEDVPAIRLREAPNAQELTFAVGNEYTNRATIGTTGYLAFSTGRAAGAQAYLESNTRMVIANNGNVGIGTTNPGLNLHVIGGVTIGGNISAVGGTFGTLAGSGTRIVVADASGNISATSTTVATGLPAPSSISGYTLRSNGTAWTANSTVYNNGTNVGIGTTAPGQKLHVASNLRVDGSIYVYDPTYFSRIYYEDSGARFVSHIQRWGGQFNWRMQSSGEVSRNLATLTAVPDSGINMFDMYSQTGGISVLRLNTNGNSYFNAGNVGIGTTNPNNALQVESSLGPVAFFKSTINSGNYSGYIGNGLSFSGEEFGLYYALNDARLVVYDQANSLLLYGGDSSNAPRLTINNNSGNVGIGTTNPVVKLQISGGGIDANGTINGTGLCIAGVCKTSWADLLGGANLWATSTAGIYNSPITSNVGIGTTNPGSYKLNVAGSIAATGMTLSGTLAMGSHSITGVSKLTVATIDPLYNIKGVNYSTFASSIAGGVKEEYVGKFKISRELASGEYERVIDMDNLEEGSDLWVWRRVVDFSKSNVEVFITPYGQSAQVYYIIENNKLIFRSDRSVEISCRLIGRRYDWRQWPTKALDQTETGIKID